MNPLGMEALATMLVLTVMGTAAAADLATPPSGPSPAERATLRYQAGSFELLSRLPLVKVLPPSDELPNTSRPLSGFWFEIQSAEGVVKYRRIMADPITLYTEASGPENGWRPERAETVPNETVFTLLIPQFPGSNQLVLVSSPLQPGGKSQPAQVVARIPLPAPPK